MARYVLPTPDVLVVVLTKHGVGILRQKGIELRSRDFVMQNILPLILTSTVALAVVVAEVRIIFPDGG